MTENVIIKPQKCESVEATSHHTDETGLAETYGEPAHRGSVDMGVDDGRPQELPGTEIDAVEVLLVDVLPVDDCDLKDLMKAITRDAKDEMSTVNREIMCVVRALGGDQQKYKRKRSRAVKAIVFEIYSLPRVTAATKLLL